MSYREKKEFNLGKSIEYNVKKAIKQGQNGEEIVRELINSMTYIYYATKKEGYDRDSFVIDVATLLRQVLNAVSPKE